MQANIIGAGTAIVMVLAFGHEPVIIGVTVMIIIAGILGLKLDASTIPIAVVTVIIIMGRLETIILFCLPPSGLP
ncbi:aromatic acid exporter family protein [Marinococcus halophilus]|uniref:aromatic acid exporter family protein n=1 Tax=Marinococcus halophilus TaxID=1371 RepID=UPI0036107554